MPCRKMFAKKGPLLFSSSFQQSFKNNFLNIKFDFDTSDGKTNRKLVNEYKNHFHIANVL